MLDDYVKVIDGMKEEVLSFIDEFEDETFVMGKDFMRLHLRKKLNSLKREKLKIFNSFHQKRCTRKHS